ncbi:glycosyltransferase family 4 protein [Hippea jasoniae]|uniref:glycosyltransferase family 4 protein n=1 Tax=Hippea jasoniae TaxID=944479 RepID=UPI00054FB021|nr:glycosyltransferase family 1 protein [Hippea jasoniae]
MQIIYDNIIFSLQKAGGISIYWYELIKRLQRKDNIIFFEKDNENIFRKKLNIKTQNEIKLPVKILRYLPFLKKLPEKSIFHSSYYRVSLQKDVLNIVTVHDFTYEFFRKGIAKTVHSLQKGFTIKKADGIICVSKNTKKDLLKFYPEIDESKIKVIYNGVGDEFKVLESKREYLQKHFPYLQNKKYILYIGDRSEYKNFHIVVEVVKKLEDFYLVIVGGKELQQFEIEMIKNKYFHLRGISGDGLNILYNNAYCLLYPSSYEGFGIPVVEAMKAGCPVISTNLSSIPEVAGDAGLLVNKIKVENFLTEIEKLKKKEFRNKLIQYGLNQSQKFSWDKCFEETYDFYKEIYKEKFNC